MTSLSKIIEQDAEYMKDVTVHVVSIYGHVTISDDKGVQEDIFLQGDDGSAFISQMKSLWHETGNLSESTIALHLAKPYVDNNWN